MNWRFKICQRFSSLCPWEEHPGAERLGSVTAEFPFLHALRASLGSWSHLCQHDFPSVKRRWPTLEQGESFGAVSSCDKSNIIMTKTLWSLAQVFISKLSLSLGRSPVIFWCLIQISFLTRAGHLTQVLQLMLTIVFGYEPIQNGKSTYPWAIWSLSNQLTG